MTSEPSIFSLFHELFHGPWPSDDPEFLAEVKRYEAALKRLLLLDSELTHHIQSQPLRDCDQIASVPVVRCVRTAQLVASVAPSGHQCVFQLSASPANLASLFATVRVAAGARDFVYAGAERPAETIRVAFEAGRAAALKVTCEWNLPLLALSPPLQKIVGAPVALLCDIATKLLAHIDARNLFDDGEVKCDAALRSLTGTDRFAIASLSEIIARNSSAMEVFSFSLDLPQSARAFKIVYPDVSTHEGTFAPIHVPPAPIREFLDAALESKEQLLAIEAFEMDPEGFVDEMVVREARMQNPTEFVNSSYFFAQPWTGEAAANWLKAFEYTKSAARKAPQPAPVRPT
jgi:hypothetical protein